MQKLIVDCSTGVQTMVDLTVEEVAQRAVDTAAAVEAQAQPDPPGPPTREDYTLLRDQLIASNEVMDEVLAIVFGG